MILFDPGMVVVLTLRILGPLLIFRWPLAGSLLSEFVFDMFDVVIWDVFHTLPKINYTAYDKILDLYFLTIMLLVSFKWTQPIPKKISLFFYLWRLAGVAIYEIVKERTVFLFCPNVFYAFFVIYLICVYLGKAVWFERVRATALIVLLVFLIKLPQEYVLHYVEFKPWMVLKKQTGYSTGYED